MAKDGTQRGGSRVGAGRKKKSLQEKVVEGKAPLSEISTLPTQEIPPPKEYLTAEQKLGSDLCAEEIYRETWAWIKACGCENFVTRQLVENYAMTQARHIQCEEMLSKYSPIAKHPTTKEPIASPFVKMSLDYLKQASQLWYQISQAVRENSDGAVGNGQNGVMEGLLRRVK